MRKMILLSVTILPFLFQNCFIEDLVNAECRSNCVEIKGVFTTEDSYFPIEGVNLELSWKQNCGLTACWFGDGSRVIATSKTDANGNYAFKFSVKEHELNSGFFSVSFDPPNNSFVTEHQRFTIDEPLKKNSSFIYNYHLPRKAVMELSLSNPELMSGDDHIVCQVIYEQGNDSDVNWSEPFDVVELSATALCEVAGNQVNVVRIFKRKAGVETITIDTVYVQRGIAYQYGIEF